MGAAKSSGQEVRVGEVFVGCAEKTGLPGFGFLWQGDNYALQGENRSRRRECKLQAQRIAAGCILSRLGSPKWESWLNDQNGLKCDQDKASGVENLRQAFNQVKVLVENGYGSHGE